jgi:type IV pilus assembly protein PilQ
MTCLRERPKFLAAGLGAAIFAAWSVPARAETVQIRNIRVSETAGDTAVVIAASARPTFTTWKLDQPARVVVELSGARLGNVDVPLDAGTYAVGLISASVTEDDSAGPRTRVVLTLRQASDYRVESKGTAITLRVIPRTRPPLAQASHDGEARAQGEAKAKAQAKAQAEAQAQRDALAKAQALAQAQARADAQARIAAEAQAEADARAQAQAKAEASLKTEKQQRQAAQAEADARAQAQAKAEASLEAEEKQRRAAQAVAEEKSRAEAAARGEAERLRKALAAAQRETELARAEATAAALESQRRAKELAHAEARVKEAQAETERARKHAATAEAEANRARQREDDRDKAATAAARQVEIRQKALDEMAHSQEEQRSRLAAAERLVAEREGSLRASRAALAAREEEFHQARARRDSLARGASEKSKAAAAAALADAERQRKDAAAATEQSRQDLALAIAARKQEEARREDQSQARKMEEQRLAQAVELRKSEEARLAQARGQRTRIDAERAALEREQAQLEASRDSLLAEVQRLKEAALATARPATLPAPSTPAPSPAQPRSSGGPAPAVIAAGQPAAAPAVAAATEATRAAGSTAKPIPPATHRPRSVTLRAQSRVRAINFVDEPVRASVIIDIDDRTTFAVERSASHRLSLRLDHTDLPDSLARNLDATEFLGPVKIISSYRDPAARTTVRIDVDLAEDVPNRIRLDGNRIYWDFQKAPETAPSLPAVVVPPPTVLFMPARKVAGFCATLAQAAWRGQVTPPPYLVPPGSAPASGGETASSAAQTEKAAPAPGRASGGHNAPGGGGKYATLGKKRYTGRRIDLDFKGADIHNILRLLADVGQVNVVIADDVRGEVTIKMRDVPWDQALDVVLRSKGLGSVREGNLLRVAPLALLEKELEAEIARQKQIAEVVPVETRLIGVSYAEAGDLMDKARDLLSPRGKISQDHRTNTLIVSDVAKNLQLIEDLVRNLDTQTSQVTIEARIVEANSNFQRQIGVQWGGTGFADTAHGNPTGLVFPYNVGVGGGADDGSSPLGGLVPGPRTGTGASGSPNFLVNMPAPAGLGTGSAIGLTLGSVAGAFNLNLRLSAMEATGQVRILSSPRITTMDNVEATISQGVSIPVSVVSAMGAQTQFVDARLSLSVKPHVTNEGTIALVINVTRNEPDFVNTGARGDPSIQKKEARTTMLVRDGDTAVIGGIYTRNTGLSNARVPFFSDIPVLGWFFRNRKENDNRSEFLVFITPRIANRARALGQ